MCMGSMSGDLSVVVDLLHSIYGFVKRNKQCFSHTRHMDILNLIRSKFFIYSNYTCKVFVNQALSFTLATYEMGL